VVRILRGWPERIFPAIEDLVDPRTFWSKYKRSDLEKTPIKIGATAISAVNHPKLLIDLSSITNMLGVRKNRHPARTRLK
jgi:hypothetical protein